MQALELLMERSARGRGPITVVETSSAKVKYLRLAVNPRQVGLQRIRSKCGPWMVSRAATRTCPLLHAVQTCTAEHQLDLDSDARHWGLRRDPSEGIDSYLRIGTLTYRHSSGAPETMVVYTTTTTVVPALVS